MSSNNHKNSDCGFAELLVSYLYDEIESADKTMFETHLKNCLSCADELAAFEGVHFSIGEWKAREFLNLAAPIIEIPSENQETAPQTAATTSVPGSWLDGLRGLFSLTTAWSTAGGAFAVIAIFAGLSFFVLNSSQTKSDELAGKNPKRGLSPTVSPSVENSNTNKIEQKTPKQVNDRQPSQPDLVSVPPNQQKVAPIKTSNPRPVTKIDNSNKTKNTRTTNKNNDSRQKAPSLSPFEEEEDETLRLADLFSEIDAE